MYAWVQNAQKYKIYTVNQVIDKEYSGDSHDEGAGSEKSRSN